MEVTVSCIPDKSSVTQFMLYCAREKERETALICFLQLLLLLSVQFKDKSFDMFIRNEYTETLIVHRPH